MEENENRPTKNTIVIVSVTVVLSVAGWFFATNQVSHSEMKDETTDIRSELATKLSIDEYREDQKDSRIRFGMIEQKLDKILDVITFNLGKATRQKTHVGE